MSNRKIKQSSVPPTELNEWGHPNEEWEFCGFDQKRQTSMWRRKTQMTEKEKVAGLNALIGEEE
tara:strand:+ start:333 stop:524 length:192 start_codon:yes stop_codon:yes gene_type:complete